MQINGQSITDVKSLFKGIDFDSIPDEEFTQVQKENTLSIKESNIRSNLPKRFENALFSDYEHQFTDELRAFALNPDDKIKILMGSVGVGKTHLLASAIHERAIKGLDCGLYFSTITLLPKLRTSRSFSAKESEEAFIQRLANTPFLCYDEFGSCTNSKEEAEFASTVLKMRYDNALPTFIATNLSPSNFKLYLCGIERGDRSPEEVEKLCKELEESNATLNRVMSVAKAYIIKGKSHRGEN